ncbi:unnamed protein product [Moneuplotes crassus]|uniref:Pyrophosphate--fructose 6-phosphate 1-phosphotransferase n=1 Tax=Euplotes crassus TaxID=5936 RepID=A0AAD1UU29_EUPCR|nr:unnamed protein product [Moneuplotes crassus]
MEAKQPRPFSDFQKHRQEFTPVYPDSLDINSKINIRKEDFGVKEEIKPLFKTLLGETGMPYVELQVDDSSGKILKTAEPIRIGCVLSGGQAPGGHNVISGLYDMVKDIHPDSKLFGFLKGPHGIFTGNFVEIEDDFMNEYRNMGGFDMIRSGRDKIESPEQFENSLKYCNDLELNGLVVIGGDDSNTNACLLAEYFNSHESKCKVVGAPKTIDGDLKNEYCEVSFGFDTATKTYSEQIGNIIVDNRSTKKYYHFIRLMGRSASHIALECYLQTRADLVLIGEEIFEKNRTLKEVTNEIVDVIVKRNELGKNYGVFLIPEGIIEFFPEMKPLISQINDLFGEKTDIEDPRAYVLEHLTADNKALFEFLPKEIADQLLLDRDPHGNVQVAKIETEILMILLCQKELEEREAKGEYSGKFHPQSHYFGYEGRCAIPSNFDTQYCYAIGRTAASLISLGYSGYMAINKNLQDSNPKNWISAGCPLPTMMGMERRKGKDKPVITKYIVELDGPMYKTYLQFKDRWSLYDCNVSPGPIQLHDPSSIDVPFLVRSPDLELLEKETEDRIKLEKSLDDYQQYFTTSETNLSQDAKKMLSYKAGIPSFLENGDYGCVVVRKARPKNIDIEQTLHEQYPYLSNDTYTTHFTEIVDKKDIKVSNTFTQDEEVLRLNEELSANQKSHIKIGIVICGRQAPGMHNVIDGLLRFAKNHGDVELIGFTNGTKGFFKGEHIIITEENFALYRNQGGCEFLGRSVDQIRTPEHQEAALETCTKFNLSGLVLVGASHSLSDAAHLTDIFLEKNIQTKVVGVPSTIFGNICGKYIESTVGFDTASKLYSQLIGNIMTDAASAVKYWYLMRLMGGDPSHLALESALQTGPNAVLISEESARDNEALPAIVSRLCDLIQKRHEEGKDFGTILIPDGLLSHLSHYSTIIDELNQAFNSCTTSEEVEKLEEKLLNSQDADDCLTPWSLSVFNILPDFIKKQLFITRKITGKFDLAQVQTEKLISHLITEEFRKRKEETGVKIPFSPVTHFFGYQGRGSLPSLFDCSLASTYGYTAGALIEHGLTGMCVTARGLMSDPADWKVGGVPFIALMDKKAKSSVYGRDKVYIKSEEVNLNAFVYQKSKVLSKQWEMNDNFVNPGPIQLFGEGKDRVNMKAHLEAKEYSEQVSTIKDLCNFIQRRCTFADDAGILKAAIASLKGVDETL